MVNWKQDFILAMILFGLAVAFYVTGLDYPDSTATFPSYLSPILGFLAILLAGSALRRRAPGQALVNWQLSRGPVLLVLLTAGFIVILPYTGFILSCFLLASSIFISLGYPNKIKAMVVAAAAAVIIYLIFHTALGVSLPIGSLWMGD